NSGRGAVWVFVRSGNTWSQQGSKLVSSTVTTVNQGTDVVLSADGNTLIVGVPNAALGGSVLYYTRTFGMWTLVNSYTDATYQRTGRLLATSADATVTAVGSNDGVSIYNFNPLTSTITVAFPLIKLIPTAYESIA